MKKNILRNIIIPISVIVSTTFVGSTITFAATLTSNSLTTQKLYNYSYGIVTNLNKGYNLNLRQQPGTDYPILSELSEGSTVIILSKQNNWYKVKYNNQIGYIFSYFLTSNNIESNNTTSNSVSVNENLVNFTASYEGFSATPYWDGDGWSVGFGQNYGDYYPANVTYNQALNTLKNSLNTYMHEVLAITKGCNLNQNQINALTDFAYNLGINNLKNSQLLQDIKDGNTNPLTITKDFQAWSYSQGVFLKGLYSRRTAEAKMFLYNQYNDNNA